MNTSSAPSYRLKVRVETQGTTEVAPYLMGSTLPQVPVPICTYLSLNQEEVGTLCFCRFPPLQRAQAACLLLHTDLNCSDQVAEMLPHKSILLAVKNEPNELH